MTVHEEERKKERKNKNKNNQKIKSINEVKTLPPAPILSSTLRRVKERFRYTPLTPHRRCQLVLVFPLECLTIRYASVSS